LKRCSVRGIAEEVVRGVGKKAFEKNITLSNYIDENMPDVMADGSMLAQVFSNLIDNAIRYTPSGGAVELSARESGDMITVSVQDNGRGIEEKHIPRIFERFYCVDKARSRDTGGTGLGLSIVKHIVRDHGGQVFVKSVPEQGSTFSFTIPKAHM
jgi:two-component system, OmpR family, phosphate regulon sensor histidine kinase PhoR